MNKKMVFACALSLLLVACSETGSDDSSAVYDSPATVPTSPDLSSEPTPTSGAPQPSHFFFSYDDSGSTAARDLTVFAIENGQVPNPAWGRPYEFLNAEDIGQFNDQKAGPFQVSMGLAHAQANEFPVSVEQQSDDPVIQSQQYALGVNVTGPLLSLPDRPNVVLTLLIDRSGSMDSLYANETRSDVRTLLDVVKYGLRSLPSSLKPGDIVNIASFDTTAELLLEGADYNSEKINQVVDSLITSGSTNLNAGIELAYQIANRNHDPSKANRVVMLTDAFANTGEVDTRIIARNTTINSLEGIHFAGIGVGSSFNDDFLNELTDIGKGVYSAMITPEDAQRIFTDGFTRFIDYAVADIRFKLEYPQEATHLSSAAEQTYTVASDVQTINFSYNDEQFFLEGITSDSLLEQQDEFVLEITYEDASGEPAVQRLERSVSELDGQGSDEILTASIIVALANLVSGELSCEAVFSSGLYASPVESVLFQRYQSLVNSFCSR